MSADRKYIWLLRHGERHDSTDKQWKATAKRPHDPPLSRAGVQQAYAAGRVIHERTLRQRGAEAMADLAIYTSPFLRCVQTAKSLSTGYYDQLTGRAKVEFDVQVKIEYGLSEFLTTRQTRHTLHRPLQPPVACVLTASGRRCAALRCAAAVRTVNFTEQITPLSHEELNRVLEGELDKFYESAHPFPAFPESVSALYGRLQSTFLSILSHSPCSTLVFVTHGYGQQVLSEYMRPEVPVTETDFACITAAEATRRDGPPVPPPKPEHDCAHLVPDPSPCPWTFSCELVCDVAHWKDSGQQGRPEPQRTLSGSILANPLPEPEPHERKA